MRKKRRTKIEIVKRSDGLWDWRIRAVNGRIVATSGCQAYPQRLIALKAFLKVAESISVERMPMIRYVDENNL